ncbi:MAG: hypothetical protein FJ225_10575 [Lentisphaerae bacterium]|nr:hypothetical protein [Lentisphaerota bacterium]
MKAAFRAHRMAVLIATLVLAGGGLLYVACEKEEEDEIDRFFSQNPYRSRSHDAGDETEALTMDPENATVTFLGEEIHFRVEGGEEPFDWSVADDGAGNVDEQGERDAIYKADTLDPNTVVAVDRDGKTAVGKINQTTAPLQIIPSGTQTILAGDTVNYEATGGSAPYDWSQFRPSFATLTMGGADNEELQYDSNVGQTGTNIVVVTDRVGDSAQVSVIQE